jgi:hypothetical protein
MSGVLVRVACTNQKRFVFRCDDTDVSLKDFTKTVLKQYEAYMKQAGQKEIKPEIVRIVDGFGFSVHEQNMSALLEGGANFGLVLRSDMDRLAAQFGVPRDELLDQLCFNREKMCFVMDQGLFKRADKKRASPELSDAPTESRKKNKGGPVKEKLAEILSKGLCLEKEIPNGPRARLISLPIENGLKALKKFEELLSKSTGGDKAQLFIQALDAIAPQSPSKTDKSAAKALTLTDEDGAKKRKTDDQTAQDAAKKAKTEVTDKLVAAASGKTLFSGERLGFLGFEFGQEPRA